VAEFEAVTSVGASVLSEGKRLTPVRQRALLSETSHIDIRVTYRDLGASVIRLFPVREPWSMALIRCPECQGQVSTRAAACPHCGNPVDTRSTDIQPDRTALKTGSSGDSTSGPVPPLDDDDPGVDIRLPPGSALPEPRSYASTAIMFAAITGLPFAILWSLLFASIQGVSITEVLPFGLGAGMFFGLFFGLTMAFFLKGETATVFVSDRKAFVSRLNVATSQLGYNPATQTEDFFTYKPSFQAGLAAGRIAVQLFERRAVVVGPKIYVKKLLRRLASESFD
jgi:hypothetical protein